MYFIVPTGRKPIAAGAYTPTEALRANEAGANFVKIFPAKTGGLEHVAAINGPLSQIPLVPTGGVGPANAGEYLEAGAVAVGAGSAIVDAIRHNDKDEPEITLSAEKGDDSVRVRVADNGPGVPEAQKKEIFGRGEKGLESAGTGIGLYLVDTLVDSYGGDVWVEDNDPEGAVFVVELPVIE